MLPLQLSAVIEATNYMREKEMHFTRQVGVWEDLYSLVLDAAERSSSSMASLLWESAPLTFMGLPILMVPQLPEGLVILMGDDMDWVLPLELFELLVVERMIELKWLKHERLTRYEWLVAREKPAVEEPEPAPTALEGSTRYTRLSQDERPPKPPPEPPSTPRLKGVVKGLLRKVFPNLGTIGVEP